MSVNRMTRPIEIFNQARRNKFRVEYCHIDVGGLSETRLVASVSCRAHEAPISFYKSVMKENAVQDVLVYADQESGYSGSLSLKKVSMQEVGELNRDQWVFDTGADIDAVDNRNDLGREYLVGPGTKQVSNHIGKR